MAVAAYASLVPLTHVLDNVHYRAQHRRLHVDILQIEALQDRVHFLLDFLETHSLLEGEKIRGLWRQISEVAFEAEQTFDSHVVNQLLSQCHGEQSGSDIILAFYEDLDRLIKKIDLIKEELSAVTAKVEDALVEKPSIFTEPGVSHPTALDGRDITTLVGFDEHVVRVMDRLTSDESKLQIIPIIGMGGIGKTTLTRHVYDKSYIVDHFDKRIWLTISQDCSVQNILQGLLGLNKESGKSLDQLAVELHKTLYGRRYLIVMDDVWTTEPCHDLMRYFPDNGNGSRIMITTRLLDVATGLGCSNPHLINFLNENQSWNLLCQKIFSQHSCPRPELEDIGKDIAKSCRGLPLAIIVIGSLLARSNMTREYWKFVCENIYSFGTLGDDDHCFKILLLSYNSLPHYMRPCFLYLRVYPEDSWISASNLIRLWVHQGFIKQIGDKSQEDIAEGYLKDLIDRNLVFVRGRLISGKVNSCGIHDLFRELCIREYDNEGFRCTPRMQHIQVNYRFYYCFDCGKQVSNKEAMDASEIAIIIPSSRTSASAHICDTCWTRYSQIKRLKLVTAMDFGTDNLIVHPTSVRSVNAIIYGYRYFKLENSSMLCVLWSLQTLDLIVIQPKLMVLPSEIWDMPQLRHLKVYCGVLPRPVVRYVEENDIMIMKNLERLVVKVVLITEEVLARIQNLKCLELFCPYEGVRPCSDCSRLNNDGSLTNLVRLPKLQDLRVGLCRVGNITFPSSLTDLYLYHLEKPSETMTIIGLLPNLEVLQLCRIQNWVEWCPVEGQFQRLKGLRIYECSLKCWEADHTHFPILEWLKLTGCRDLEEIPLAIGDIATLRTIEVNQCSESTFDSVKQLWEEQQSYGNESLQICVTDCDGKRHRFGDVKVDEWDLHQTKELI